MFFELRTDETAGLFIQMHRYHLAEDGMGGFEPELVVGPIMGILMLLKNCFHTCLNDILMCSGASEEGMSWACRWDRRHLLCGLQPASSQDDFKI